MNEFIVSVNNKKFLVDYISEKEVQLGNNLFKTDIHEIDKNVFSIRLENKTYEVVVNKLDQEKYGILLEGNYFETTVRTKLQEKAVELKKYKEKLHHHAEIKAPMPGLILKLKKNIGDKVDKGDALLILEAMKMENELKSSSNGIIKDIYYREGQSVEKGSIILTIE
jgi:biotin carboxyl carrier protein